MDVNFITANIIVGLAIAIDAMLATILQFHRMSSLKRALTWGFAVSLTHWIFPMFGFVGGWYLSTIEILTWLIYVIGALLLAFLLFNIIKEAISTQVIDTNQSWYSNRTFILLVLGVSWDALISGPGKTAIAADWSNEQIWLSFNLVGVVVFVCVLTACYPAIRLNRMIHSRQAIKPDALAKFITIGILLEIALFSGFMLLSIHSLLGSIFEQFNFTVYAQLMWLTFNLIILFTLSRKIHFTQQQRAKQLTTSSYS